MLIYEVNLTVQTSISDDYLIWLKQHMHEMLSIEGFLNATLYRLPTTANADTQQFVAHYSLHSQATLDNYLTQYAPKMRADGIARFNDQFSAQRRILYPVS